MSEVFGFVTVGVSECDSVRDWAAVPYQPSATVFSSGQCESDVLVDVFRTFVGRRAGLQRGPPNVGFHTLVRVVRRNIQHDP